MIVPIIDELQSILPRGVRLGAPISNGPFGSVFTAEDRRLGETEPIIRHVRILRVDEQADWKTDFEARLRLLAQADWPHVQRLLEIGRSEDGKLFYMIYDQPKATLASLLRDAAGIQDHHAAWHLFVQLAQGLETLHDHALVHGDLRPENVIVDSSRLEMDVSASIANVAVGQLAFWSGGELLEDESRHYYPPETNFQLGKPTPKSDVYALGLIGCELLLGRNAVRDLAPGKHWPQLRSRLQRHRFARSRIFVLQRMLDANPRNRLAEGRRVAEAIALGPAWRRRAQQAAVVLSTLLLAILVIAFALKVQQLTSSLDAVNGERKKLEAFAEQLKRENRDLQGEISELKRAQREPNDSESHVATPAPVPAAPEEVARKAWADLPANFSPADVDSLIQRQNPPATEKKFLEKWKVLVQQATKDVGTAKENSRQPKALAALRRQPWDDGLRRKLAQAAWRDYLSRPSHLGYSKLGLKSVQQGIEKLDKTSPIRSDLMSWWKSRHASRARWIDWLDSRNRDLTRPYHAAIDTPWDEELCRLEKMRLEHLNAAATIWKARARIPDQTWDQFKVSLDAAAEARADAKDDLKLIFGNWIDKFNELQTDCDVELVKQSVPGGWGLLLVKAGGADFNYTLDGSPVTLRLNWKSRPLVIEAQGARTLWRGYYGRPQLLRKELTGPLPIWSLNEGGTLRDSATGCELHFKVKADDLPGPPWKQ